MVNTSNLFVVYLKIWLRDLLTRFEVVPFALPAAAPTVGTLSGGEPGPIWCLLFWKLPEKVTTVDGSEILPAPIRRLDKLPLFTEGFNTIPGGWRFGISEPSTVAQRQLWFQIDLSPRKMFFFHHPPETWMHKKQVLQQILSDGKTSEKRWWVIKRHIPFLPAYLPPNMI